MGDTVNLTSRIENLTRFFNTGIIITSNFLPVAQALGLPIRRLGCFCVKGRADYPEILFAVGREDDVRFQPEAIAAWETWLENEENGATNNQDCPVIFDKDRHSLTTWKQQNLLANKVWHLNFK